MQVQNSSPLPRISVVVPSYNKGPYVARTLQSILDQRYPNLQVIVQDGGSTDGTLPVLEDFANRHPALVHVTSERDGGQLDAINRGLAKADGDVLAFLNADDTYAPGALLRVGHAYRARNPLWITGFGAIVDANDRPHSGPVTAYKNLLTVLNRYPLLLAVNYIVQPATFISRAAYEQLGPFTGLTRTVMEYDYWLRLGRRGMPTVIPHRLANFRLIAGTISTTSFVEVLRHDDAIAARHTRNPALLAIHRWHNRSRAALGRRFGEAPCSIT